MSATAARRRLLFQIPPIAGLGYRKALEFLVKDFALTRVDPGRYPNGVVIRDEQMAQIQLEPHRFHGDWNYTIRPRRKTL